ncbi:uncharacterized protein [Halyomorpha halys]|uniref:uncharacterized protein n=1 Tax=Halyomorpha halys TaxID=286706 RepID=UPI0006D5007E|nr:laccase-3-like [Halyomorpha halys]
MIPVCHVLLLLFLVGLVRTESPSNTSLRSSNFTAYSDSQTIVGAQGILNGFRFCVRRCDGRPRTCYYRLNIARYSVLGGACRNCAFGTPSDCMRPQCITANGWYRGMIAVNRQLPAPPIQVCKGDRIIADVENALPDATLSIHWHGLRQKGFQYYDGVPYVTQCPILPGTIFRYNFVVEEAGTFFYHSHTGLQKMDGVAGALIVRDVYDSQSHFYDEDRPDHVMFIGDWTNRPAEEYLPGFNHPDLRQIPDTFLINGKGMHWANNRSMNLPLAEFLVNPGQRYRFRLIGGTCMSCAVAVRFQGHRVLAIAADGNLKFAPRLVDTVILNSADRFDVILEANQYVGTFFIFAESIQERCSGVRQVAILRYQGSNTILRLPPPPPSNNLGIEFNAVESRCDGSNSNKICIAHLQGLTDAPPIGNQYYAFLFVGFDFYIFDDDDLFAPGTYQHYDEPIMGRRVKALVNNISFTFPPSNMLTQFNEIPRGYLCNSQCYSSNIQKACSCSNFYNLPYNTVVNVIIYDNGNRPALPHPYHLHGFNFHVLAQGVFPSTDPQDKQLMLNRMMYLLNNDNVNLRSRPQRDTISVPPLGYVLTRFYTDNPGYWLLHCHFAYHLESGMAAVFRVGDQSLLPPVPENFPRCGNFLPPP